MESPQDGDARSLAGRVTGGGFSTTVAWNSTRSSGRSGRIALGRKNHVFAGSDGGVDRWAIVSSLITTAKLNKVEP
jgi:hypothetical protein